MIKLKDILKEELPPSLKKMVGNVLLGGRHTIAQLQKKEKEPNTSWENEFEDALDAWVDNSSDEVAGQFYADKEDYDELKDEFPMIMQPPQGKTAYRGTIIKLDSLKNALENRSFKVVNVPGQLGTTTFLRYSKLPYTPNRPAQSWTTDPKVAMRFGEAGINELQVLYTTKINDDFIFNPKLLSLLTPLNEKEVVRVAEEGEFNGLVSVRALATRDMLHKLKPLQGYFEKARLAWNKKVPSVIEKNKRKYKYKEKDLTIDSWDKVRSIKGYESGLGPVADYYKKIIESAIDKLKKGDL